MNRPRRNLLVPALIALGVYGLAAALLWQVLPARPRLAFGPGVDHVASSPGGEFIAVKDPGAGPFRVAEVSDGRECFRIADAWGEEGGSAEFSLDGRLVLVSRTDGRWMVLDSRTGARLIDRWRPSDLRCVVMFGRTCQFAGDNGTLIFLRAQVRGGEGGGAVTFHPIAEVWDLESGGLRATLPGVRDPQVMPDGRSWVATEEALSSLAVPIPGRGVVLPARLAGRGIIEDREQARVIRRRDLAGQALWTLPGWVGPAKSLVIRRDGGELAWGVDGVQAGEGVPERPAVVHRWDLGSGRGLAPVPLEPPVDSRGANLKRAPQTPSIDRLLYQVDGATLGVTGVTGVTGMAGDGLVCRWAIHGDAARLGPASFGIPSPDGRWFATYAEYKWKDPLKPGGISIQELPSFRERVRILPAGADFLGFRWDSRLLLVQNLSGRQDPFTGMMHRFLFPGGQVGAISTVRAHDVLTGRPVGMPIRTAIQGHSGVHRNDTLIFSGEEGVEVWDILPRRPWREILGYAAIPAAIPLLIGVWRRRPRRIPAGSRASPEAAGAGVP